LTQPRGIDHLVLPIRDLDAAGAHYGAMGFQVGGRNRHPWGTENRIIQLPGAFLELIALGEAIRDIPPGGDDLSAPRFLRFIRRFLRDHGDGFAMLVLESTDAEADRAALDAVGIGGLEPFFFERTAERPDGSRVRVAFTLAFAESPAITDAGFFVCQQHEPQNFWNPAFQAHPNGATALGGVVMLAQDVRVPLGFLEAFSGARAACAGERNIAIVTPRGTIEAMTPACFSDVIGLEAGAGEGARLSAFKIFAPVEAMAARLEAANIAFVRHKKHLAVAAADNFGAALVFEEPRSQ